MILSIKVTPRASSNVVVGRLGENPETVALKVCAPAEGGKANEAVIRLLADELDIPKHKVSIQRGASSRHKLVAVDISPDILNAWLGRLKRIDS